MKNVLMFVGILFVLSCPSLLLACSGPGAPRTIEGNSNFAALSFLTAFILVVDGCRRRQKLKGNWKSFCFLFLIFLHPLFFQSPNEGDCGMRLGFFSLVYLMVIVILWAAVRKESLESKIKHQPWPNIFWPTLLTTFVVFLFRSYIPLGSLPYKTLYFIQNREWPSWWG